MIGALRAVCVLMVVVTFPTAAHSLENKRQRSSSHRVDPLTQLMFLPFTIGTQVLNTWTRTVQETSHRLYKQPIPICDKSGPNKPKGQKRNVTGGKKKKSPGERSKVSLMESPTEALRAGGDLQQALAKFGWGAAVEGERYGDYLAQAMLGHLAALGSWNQQGYALWEKTVFEPILGLGPDAAGEVGNVIAGKTWPGQAMLEMSSQALQVANELGTRANSAITYAGLVHKGVSDVGNLTFPGEKTIWGGPFSTLTYIPPDPIAARKRDPNTRPVIINTESLAAGSRAPPRFWSHPDGPSASFGLAAQFHAAGVPVYLAESREPGSGDTRTPGQIVRDKLKMSEAVFDHAGGRRAVALAYCAETMPSLMGLSAEPDFAKFIKRLVTVVGAPNPRNNDKLAGTMDIVPKSLIRFAFTMTDMFGGTLPHWMPFVGALDGSSMPSKLDPAAWLRPGWKNPAFAGQQLHELDPKLAASPLLTAWTAYPRLEKLNPHGSLAQQFHLAAHLYGLGTGEIPGLPRDKRALAGTLPHILPVPYDAQDGSKRQVSVLQIPQTVDIHFFMHSWDQLISPKAARDFEGGVLPNVEVHHLAKGTHTGPFSRHPEQQPYNLVEKVLKPDAI